jgi:hypothetical protein
MQAKITPNDREDLCPAAHPEILVCCHNRAAFKQIIRFPYDRNIKISCVDETASDNS